MKIISLILCTCVCVMVSLSPLWAEEKPVRRTVLGIYDSKMGDPRYSRIHQFLEMPLNYLGYRVEYQDVQEKLAPLSDQVEAVIVWVAPDSKVEHADAWLKWLNTAVDSGRKLILFGDLGITQEVYESKDGLRKINRLLNKIGINDTGRWLNLTYDARIKYVDPALTGFERKYRDMLMPYESINKIGKESVSHLQIVAPQYENEISDLMVTHPRGGYVSADYAIYEQLDDKNNVVYHQWYINPFRFLQAILEKNPIPKADVTTLNGRRIFYSHIDGDGWNSITELEEYKGKHMLVSEVLLHHIFARYTDFPFTVGIVAGEVMPQCYGVPNSEAVARKIFALPNVEPGSHTFSHPLYWGFYADGKGNEKEVPFQDKFPEKPYEQFFVSKWLLEKEQPDYALPQKYAAPEGVDPLRGIRNPNMSLKSIFKDYTTPRSFACDPFNLASEITGSMRYAESLASGKKVKLYQWSGDTSPFEAAVAEVRLNGAYNINGGGSRYDVEYPSYTSIASIGVPVGAERQIYSSNTNENDYTNLWTGRFFGFRYLQTTVENTETPIRVHPFNIYFHSYSGQKQASLNALKDNFRYAQSLPLSPVFASDYVTMANHFYQTEFVEITPDKWRVLNRGAVQTIRFDQATLKSVDINNSKGVLGQKYLQGSLYVSLDSAEKTPVIALKPRGAIGGYSSAEFPYLIESNWKINSLKFIKNKLTFFAEGLGKPDMIWLQPSAGKYSVKVQSDSKTIFEEVVETSKNAMLHLSLPASDSPLSITIIPTSQTAL